MKYYYSPSENLMYSDINRSAYEESNMWPSDLIEISKEIFSEYAGTPPSGKKRSSGGDGLPAWVDIPSPTKDELIVMAESQRQYLMSITNERIVPLQDAVELNIATDEEKQRYDNLRKYRVLLSRLDTSLAPNIDWPIKPAFITL